MTPDELEKELNNQMKTLEEQREQALVQELVLKNNLETARTSLGFVNGRIAQLKDTIAKLKK
jgi:hypothetical protein